ncbi:MAG: QueT transporter family protein [Clostridiales bacterium]|nr:QueT transporter family protein [Clostridiales bacterium]
MNSRQVSRAALIAALYFSATVALQPLGYGPVQFRVSEALAVLPFLLPRSAVPGLFVGCLMANLFGGYGLPDIVFGSLATLVAAHMTARCKSRFTAPIPPILVNALVIGPMLYVLYYGGPEAMPLWLPVLQVGAGQLAACYGLGLPLLALLERLMPSERAD